MLSEDRLIRNARSCLGFLREFTRLLEANAKTFRVLASSLKEDIEAFEEKVSHTNSQQT